MNKYSTKVFCLSVLVAIGSFVMGRLSGKQIQPVAKIIPMHQEIAVIHFQQIEGDSIVGSISGPARIVWSESQVIEAEGGFQLPIGQLSTETDRALTELEYVGNAKTNKFYPSSSYPARGTEVQYRRFFATKEAAEAAGFVPSKLVK